MTDWRLSCCLASVDEFISGKPSVRVSVDQPSLRFLFSVFTQKQIERLLKEDLLCFFMPTVPKSSWTCSARSNQTRSSDRARLTLFDCIYVNVTDLWPWRKTHCCVLDKNNTTGVFSVLNWKNCGVSFSIHEFKKVSGDSADSHQKANKEGYKQLKQKYADFSHLCMNACLIYGARSITCWAAGCKPSIFSGEISRNVRPD